MKCRSCGTEIAANALICYKCGTATAEPKIQPPSARPRRSRPALTAAATVVALALALWASQQAGCLTLL